MQKTREFRGFGQFEKLLRFTDFLFAILCGKIFIAFGQNSPLTGYIGTVHLFQLWLSLYPKQGIELIKKNIEPSFE